MVKLTHSVVDVDVDVDVDGEGPKII